MKFKEYVKLFQKTVIIDSSTFKLYDNPNDLRRQVLRWVSKKYLYPLKKGMYVLSDEYRKTEPSLLFVANQLVAPSYVSTEYALGLYDLIPEKVTVITSLTTKKTQVYNNTLGKFEYRSINKGLFFGMVQKTENGQKYFIAEPEKAVLDFLYFAYDAKPDLSYFESMRFQNLSKLNRNRLLAYSKKYNKRIQNLTHAILPYMKNLNKEFRRL